MKASAFTGLKQFNIPSLPKTSLKLSKLAAGSKVPATKSTLVKIPKLPKFKPVISISKYTKIAKLPKTKMLTVKKTIAKVKKNAGF